MNRITLMLKSSDVMPVRRAVFAAGANRVLVTPLPRQESTKYLDWYFGKPIPSCDAPVKVDVGVDESHVDGVISAFLRTASVGKIEKVTKHVSKPKSFPLPILQAA
jgi:hypothetical protein